MSKLLMTSLLCLSLISAVPVYGADSKTKSTKAGDTSSVTWGHIELKGGYDEGAQAPGLFGELKENLAGALARFDKAADDDNLKGLIVHINSPELGWAKMSAFRQAIQRVRDKGKKVYGYLESAGNLDYLLATACDEIVVPESGVLMLVGLRAEVGFYKTLLDKLGIKAEMLRVGEYKSAAEPYSRTEMSPEFRKEMEALLDDLYAHMKHIVAESRKLDEDKVASAIDNGPMTAGRAKELGLIDRVAYEDEIRKSIDESVAPKTVKLTMRYGRKKIDTDFSGFGGMMKFMELVMGVEPAKRKTSTPKIAVINAHGAINTGKSKTDLFGSSSLGSETLIKAIRTANKDSQVKAIVLRVDSPGGSALASDLIWRELELVNKPFVASMGDVAASGGYYISMGADRIFAEPGTITGSIGVVGGKLALEGLYGKLGINTSVISRGKNSGVLSSTTPFANGERESMQALLNDIYAQFTRKAAVGRKMDLDKLEPLARGRIYAGSAALKIGLVDELGSLDDAVASAKKMAGLSEDEKVERLVLPKAVNPLEALFGPLDPNSETQSQAARAMLQMLRELSPEVADSAHAWSMLQLLSREPALTVLPFQIRLK